MGVRGSYEEDPVYRPERSTGYHSVCRAAGQQHYRPGCVQLMLSIQSGSHRGLRNWGTPQATRHFGEGAPCSSDADSQAQR